MFYNTSQFWKEIAKYFKNDGQDQHEDSEIQEWLISFI